MSDSRPGGNTRRWRATRERWAELLPLPCHHCHLMIQPWQAWDLDHLRPLATGDIRDDLVRPAHAWCNRSAGGALGAAITNARHNQHQAPGW